MEKVIRDFAATMGKTVEESVKRMAKSSCKRLASTVQPFGIGTGKPGTAKLRKFVKSIGTQVDRAWFGTNLGAFEATTNMKQAHYNARRNGSVPKRLFRKEKDKPWLHLISESERNAYKKKAQAKAFRAKAAWIKAGDDLGKPKLSGIDARVRRNVPNAWGGFTSSGKEIQTKITVFNKTPYVEQIQSASDVKASAMEGMKNGLAYMQNTTKKTIEKANREMQ